MSPGYPIPARRKRDFKVPNDLSDFLPCPVCGHTKLAGVLVVFDSGRWWRCSECFLCIPATETARKTIQAFQREV